MNYIKALATVVASVVSALTPFYGRLPWFVALVAGASALALIAPSVLPSKASAVPSKG